MLYKDFRDQDLECDSCPLNDGEICPGGMTSNGRGEPVEPPCCSFDDDTDMEEWVRKYYEYQRKCDEAEDARIKAQREKEAKNAIARERRRKSQRHVWHENHEIKLLKQKIAKNERMAEFARSLAEAFNTTNKMFRYGERIEIKERTKTDIENDEMRERIAELKATKKEKLKAFRKNYLREGADNGWP